MIVFNSIYNQRCINMICYIYSTRIQGNVGFTQNQWIVFKMFPKKNLNEFEY